jgi:hypothetical protein
MMHHQELSAPPTAQQPVPCEHITVQHCIPAPGLTQPVQEQASVIGSSIHPAQKQTSKGMTVKQVIAG